jgi:hypothetical protein
MFRGGHSSLRLMTPNKEEVFGAGAPCGLTAPERLFSPAGSGDMVRLNCAASEPAQ